MSSITIRTDFVEITPEMVRSVIHLGGYTHPLFATSETAEAHSASGPLPGQGVMLFMGGLLEQSGHLDHAIALLELTNVRFLRMVREGMHIAVEMTEGESRSTSSGKRVQHYTWTVIDTDEHHILEAQAVMLVHENEGASGR